MGRNRKIEAYHWGDGDFLVRHETINESAPKRATGITYDAALYAAVEAVLKAEGKLSLS